MSKIEKIVLFGAPGAGKGTLAGRIKGILPEIVHISTGDLFRKNLKNQTPIGKKAKEYMDAGKLVPDEVVIGMVESRMDQDDVKSSGFMLDGFPRTLVQAEKLSEITEVNHVYVLTVPRDILLKRILGRVSCSKCNKIFNIYTLRPKKEGICDKCGAELMHRSDDTEATLNNRIDTYEENAGPVIKYYTDKNVVQNVDSTNTMELSGEDIKKELGL